jgi:hypothetical protein
MATITFSNGTKVNFNGNPTPADVEEVAQKLGLKSSSATPQSTDTVGGMMSNPETGMDIVTGFGKGILRTAVSGAEALDVVGSKLTGLKPIGTGNLAEVAKPTNLAQKIGYGLEKTAETLAPIPGASKAKAAVKASEMISKVPKIGGVLKTGIRAGMEGGEQILRTAVGTGDVEQAKTEGAIAAAIPVVGGVLGKAKKLIGSSKTGEILTGVKAETWDRWKKIVSSDPNKAAQLKNVITESPDKPFLVLAERINRRITEMKNKAQTAWTTAKDAWKASAGDISFDLSTKLPQLNKTLGEFGLRVARLRDRAGQMTGRVSLQASGKVTPFSPIQRQQIENLAVEMNKANALGVDDLQFLVDKFDEAYDAIPLNVDGTATKYHALVSKLKNEVRGFTEEVLPEELKAARSLYREYYDVYDKIGTKIRNKSGELKDTAQSYLANIGNLNKGKQRKDLIEAGNKMGIDILDVADDLKTVQQIVQTVPQTTKNRTMDFIRGALSSKVLGGGAGVATATGMINPVIGVPALLVNIFSSPVMYSNTIEVLAGIKRKIPIQKAIESIPPEELDAIRRALIRFTGEQTNQ